jgi:hypothetical protein
MDTCVQNQEAILQGGNIPGKKPSKCQHFSKSKQTSSSPASLIHTNPEKAFFYI